MHSIIVATGLSVCVRFSYRMSFSVHDERRMISKYCQSFTYMIHLSPPNAIITPKESRRCMILIRKPDSLRITAQPTVDTLHIHLWTLLSP